MYRRNKGLGKPTEIRKKDIGKCSGSLARAQQGFRQMTRSAPLFGFQLGQANPRKLRVGEQAERHSFRASANLSLLALLAGLRSERRRRSIEPMRSAHW